MADDRTTPEEALAPTGERRGATATPSALERLGITKEPSKGARYLRAILAGLQEMEAEQIKQIPIVGPLLSGAGIALLELSREEEDTSLEEKVSQILASGEQNRETLEVLSSLAAAIYLQQRALIVRLQAVGLPAERHEIEAISLSTALAAYRGRVARDYQYADHRGIEGGTRAEHAASLPLDEVYVEPRLLPERSQVESRDRERHLLKELLDNANLPSAERVKLEEEFAKLTGKRWRASQGSEDGGVPVGQALATERCVVVIGGPGVGKSALIRYLARACAEGQDTVRKRLGESWGQENLTPIVLSLAAYAAARSREQSITLHQFLNEFLIRNGGEALRAAIERELLGRRVFFFLEGIDEIPNSRERFLIVKVVDQFLADYSENRFLITSRPYGYIRLVGEIAHFQLPNFSQEQVRNFVYRWQCAFERWRHPHAPDLEQAEKDAAAMLEEIGGNPKVSELATNPLMLLILGLIRHEQAQLPQERVQLYDRAVKTLMDSWNRGRSLAGIDVGGLKLPLDRLVRVWSAVAEWTRREKPTGVVHRAELKRKLVQVLADEELNEDDPEATAESYLNAAADRAGLLEERGKDIFAFWHSTFEEFLAAVELATPSAKAIERLLPLRANPRWREVILLAIGYLAVVQRDRETATAVVEAIWLEKPGPLEPLLHNHLRLAAASVADDIGIKRSLVERIILRLGEVVRTLPYQPFVDAFTLTVRALPNLRLTRDAVVALEPLAEHSSWMVQMEAARLFSNAAADDPRAQELCHRLLKDGNGLVQCHAALGLVQAGEDTADIWLALTNLESRDAHIKRGSIEQRLSKCIGKAQAALEPLLKSDDRWSRLQAADVLRKLGAKPERAREVLQPWLMGEQPELRWQAADVLSWIGGEPETILEALRPLLTGDQPELRLRAADVLIRIDGESEPVLESLGPLLTGDQPELRLRAADVLRRLGCEHAYVLEALEPMLIGDELELRWRAADVLIRIGGAPELILEALQPLLIGDELELRWRAADVLIRIGDEPELVVEALEPLLASEQMELRLQAADVLRRLGGEPARILGALEPWLAGDHLELLWRAAQVMSRTGGAAERVLAAVEPLLTSERREDAVGLLLTKAGAERVALEHLMKILTSKHLWYLGCCDKILSGQALTEAEAAALSELVQRRSDKGNKARALFFDWIYRKLSAPSPVAIT